MSEVKNDKQPTTGLAFSAERAALLLTLASESKVQNTNWKFAVGLLATRLKMMIPNLEGDFSFMVLYAIHSIRHQLIVQDTRREPDDHDKYLMGQALAQLDHLGFGLTLALNKGECPADLPWHVLPATNTIKEAISDDQLKPAIASGSGACKPSKH